MFKSSEMVTNHNMLLHQCTLNWICIKMICQTNTIPYENEEIDDGPVFTKRRIKKLYYVHTWY